MEIKEKVMNIIIISVLIINLVITILTAIVMK